MLRLFELGRAIAAAERGLSLAMFARKTGHPRSSLYRDVQVLRQCGIPIESRDQRLFLPANFRFFGAGGFSADEVLALGVVRALAGRLPGTVLERRLATVWAKLGATTGGRATEDNLTVAAFNGIDYAAHRDTIELLSDAAARRVAVALRYRKGGTGEISTRVFEPHALHADAVVEGLYAVGYCRWRRAVRTFAVHRILHAEKTGEIFDARPELATQAKIRDAFRAWVTSNPPTPVRLRFSAAVADAVIERRHHPSQTVALTADGEAVVELRLGEPACLTRWLMAFGADVAVEEPSWLATELQERHRAAAEGTDRPKALVRHKAS